jgi:polar amino acid transport system substrate-binding protein
VTIGINFATRSSFGSLTLMQRRTFIQSALATLFCNRAVAQALSPAATASLAPTGRIRVAINYGNAALAVRDATTGKLSGVSVDIAEELARRTGLPITMVPFDAAGKVSAAVKNDAWDVAFLARDPERAREISFTAAYVVIGGTYVVRKESPLTSVAQVDGEGVRIVVSTNSAYDLFLTRSSCRPNTRRLPASSRQCSSSSRATRTCA